MVSSLLFHGSRGFTSQSFSTFVLQKKRGLDNGFHRCPVLSLPLPAFSVSPFAKRLLTAMRSAFARPHRTASPPPPQATKHLINKITKNNYKKNNLTTFLSIPMPDDCRVLVG